MCDHRAGVTGERVAGDVERDSAGSVPGCRQRFHAKPGAQALSVSPLYGQDVSIPQRPGGATGAPAGLRAARLWRCRRRSIRGPAGGRLRASKPASPPDARTPMSGVRSPARHRHHMVEVGMGQQNCADVETGGGVQDRLGVGARVDEELTWITTALNFAAKRARPALKGRWHSGWRAHPCLAPSSRAGATRITVEARDRAPSLRPR